MKNILIQNAIAHNKYLTKKYLENKSIDELLNFCNYMDRKDYCKRLNLDPEIYEQKYTKNI